MRVLSLFILLSLLGVGSSQCTASTLIVTGSTTYDCMMNLSPEVTLHWDLETSGTAAVAATTTSVNGWFSVSFPDTLGSMIPAIGVSSSGETTADIYSITERTAGGITLTTETNIDSPTTEIVDGMCILRFNVADSFLTAAMPVNFAFHSSEMGFPANIHTKVGSVVVDFVEPTFVVMPPSEPVVRPPAAPLPPPADDTINFEVVAELSDLVSQVDTLVAAASTAIGESARCDKFCRGNNCFNCDGTAATQRSVPTLVRANWRVILIILSDANENTPQAAVDNSLKKFLSNNAVIGYVDGSAVVVVANSINQHQDFDNAHTQEKFMMAIWLYWVPLAVIIKVLGPFVFKGVVFGYAIPLVIHMLMMFTAMCLTRVDYVHGNLGAAILMIGWVQIVSVLFLLRQTRNLNAEGTGD